MTNSLTIVAKVFSNTLKPFLQTFEYPKKKKKKKKKKKSMYLLYLKVEF